MPVESFEHPVTLMMSISVVHLDSQVYSEGPVESCVHPVTFVMSMLVVPLDTLIRSEGPLASFVHPVNLMLSILAVSRWIRRFTAKAQESHLLIR